MIVFLLSFSSSLIISSYEEKSFIAWMRSTNQYFTNDEYHFRLGIYLTNSRYIRQFNSNSKSTFKVGLNRFACYTPSEYNILLGYKTKLSSTAPKSTRIYLDDDLPEKVDWREKNVVNAIKNQGQCGSCWAFAVVQACESSYAISHGTLYSCSEQNLVDCCTDCDGCGGGYEDLALDFVIQKQNGYLNSESDYPYISTSGECKYDESKRINQVKSYTNCIKHDESYLQKMVANGVCQIAIDASWISFQLYTGGIYDNPSCFSDDLNHAVGLVGYGTDDGVEYWLVRNSWATSWGEGGYVRMSRNKDNQCGIATVAQQVIA